MNLVTCTWSVLYIVIRFCETKSIIPNTIFYIWETSTLTDLLLRRILFLHSCTILRDWKMETSNTKPLDSVLWTESIQQVALLYSPCFPYNFSPLKRILMYRSHLCRLSSHMNVLHGRDYIIIKLYAIIIPSKKKSNNK